MELKLYINQTLTYNINGDQVYYTGNNPQNLVVTKVSAVPFPSGRQFPSYPSPVDVTDYVSDLYKLKLTWTAQKDSNGNTVPGATQLQKSTSGTLVFEGQAYDLLKKWLIDDVSAPLNSVDVAIEHVGCGRYINYAIRAKDLQWCENSTCTFDVTIKQKDERLNCIKSTLIGDNHDGLFQTTPTNGRKHPRFSYCNEHRPNGLMVMVWWISGVIIVPTLLVFVPLMAVLNVVFWIVNKIIGVINTLVHLVSGKPLNTVNWNTIPYFDFNAMLNALGAYFAETAGCGREHPAPLIRDYISNVCRKCNVEVDGATAPIFFDPLMKIETSSRGMIQPPYNPHYNACYLNAPVERGIRRYKSLNALRALANNTDYYIPDNTPLHTLDTFLDELKVLYNAEWRVKNGKLYFQRKDWFLQQGYVYDLSHNSADRLKLLEGVCFEWNEVKSPAYTKGLYTDDALDSSGNEAQKQMNALVSHGSVDDNPNIEGVREIRAPFGATKFRLDGASEDYVYDAMQVVVNGSFLTPFLAGLMFDFVAPFIEEHADYALLMKDETCTLPKVLIWDGVNYDNAKCIRSHTSRVNYGFLTEPQVNSKYNKYGFRWYLRHPERTFVRGAGLTLPPNQDGYYLVTDFFGAREIKKPALLVNYPMYFEPGYLNTMWDWFHWIDDPEHNPKMNMNWSAKLELCCYDLKNLELFGDLTDIKLGQRVKLPLKYYPDGNIAEIEVSYDTKDENGQYIELKGTV